MAQTPFNPFAGGDIFRAVPTTEPQREIWLTVALGGDQASLAYNESLSAYLDGELDLDALGRAVADLAARHESLRTSFSGDGQQMLVSAEANVAMAVDDLMGLDEEAREERRREIVASQMRTPFDLRTGPLFWARLIRLSPVRHELVLTAHHIVCDGWSIGVLLSELPALYAARREGRAAELPPAPSYADYAVREREGMFGAEAAEAERHWVSVLGASPKQLDLPTDRPRTEAMVRVGEDDIPVRDLSAAREDYRLEPALVEGLRAVGRARGASLVATLLAAFDALLYRLSGQTEFVVGMPSAGQAATGAHGLVGHCVNTLPLPVRLDPDAPFVEHVASMRRAILDGSEHQRLSFGGLLQKLELPRDPSRVPLMPVIFNLDQELAPARVGEARMTYFTNPRAAENFELFVNATQTDGTLVLETSYNTRLFERATILRWLEELRVLLEGVVAKPDAPLGRLPILPPAEREWLVHGVNATALELPAERTTLERIEAQVARTPDAVAVVDERRSLTYRALDRQANHLAARLVEAGVKPGDYVGICLERGAPMLVALLATWKAGGAYVPLDPAYPSKRLRFVVDDTKMGVLVTEPELGDVLADAPLRRVLLEGALGEADAPPPRAIDRDSVAYVLHTSGSTGTPKGVVIEHGSLLNLVTSMAKEPGMVPSNVLLAVITLSFDMAGYELFVPLTVGARVVIASREATMDGAALAALVTKHGVDVLQATPVTFRFLVEAGFRGGPGFKAISGGEPLPIDLIAALLPRVGSLWNAYGPTETTIYSTATRVESARPPISIGPPIANTQVYVLDPHGELVPTGAEGELYIGGAGVARSYLGRPELTAERFVPDPFSSEPGARLYRTGDQVRLGADGALFFVGRKDGQVKIRGFRIELGEIEAALAACPGVRRGAAAVRELAPGDARLIGYYVLDDGASTSQSAVAEELRHRLPPQMLPQHLMPLEALPLTPNGKLDRKALPMPDLGAGGADTYVAPSTETQRKLVAIWTELLRADRVGIRDGFFETGGHSMLAVRMLSRVRELFGVELPLRVVFQAQTIEALSERLEAALLQRGVASAEAGGGGREEIEF